MEAFGVVACSDEELGGGVVADAVDVEEPGSGPADQRTQEFVQPEVLVVEVLGAVAELTQRDQGRVVDDVSVMACRRVEVWFNSAVGVSPWNRALIGSGAHRTR